MSAPPMPEGFTDRTAWDAIHWKFSENGSLLDQAVIDWQRANQERVKAAALADSNCCFNLKAPNSYFPAHSGDSSRKEQDNG